MGAIDIRSVGKMQTKHLTRQSLGDVIELAYAQPS
jgi:hypothetical protein